MAREERRREMPRRFSFVKFRWNYWISTTHEEGRNKAKHTVSSSARRQLIFIIGPGIRANCETMRIAANRTVLLVVALHSLLFLQYIPKILLIVIIKAYIRLAFSIEYNPDDAFADSKGERVKRHYLMNPARREEIRIEFPIEEFSTTITSTRIRTRGPGVTPLNTGKLPIFPIMKTPIAVNSIPLISSYWIRPELSGNGA